MNIIIIIIIIASNLILILAAAYWYSRQVKNLQIVFWLALLLKLVSGIALGLLYTYYYKEADTFNFFQDAVHLSKLSRLDFGTYINFLWHSDASSSVWGKLITHQPRDLFFVKVISLVNLLTADNYWITSLYFSFLSFIFSWRLMLTLIDYFPAQKPIAILSFLFIPTTVFWGSGIIKESLALASLLCLTHTFLKLWMEEKNPRADIILSIVSLWILWQVKYYYLAIFVPVVGTSLIVKFIFLRFFRVMKIRYEIIIWFIVFFFSIFLVSLTRNNFHIGNLAHVIVKNHNAFQKLSKTDDTIHFYNLNATGLSLIINSPWALFSGLFRPFIWEVTNVFQAMLALENLFVIIVFVMAVKNFNELFQSPNRLLSLSVIVYACLLCVFLTLSTPNFGTLARYRVGFLPFLIFLLGYKNPFIAYFFDLIQRKISHLVR